ncbi:hypothetical protein CWI37_0369p0010 [Hamiltosporidium tvaerminnensis]|uniref:Uncharacterized protein n=1 Tax=Hamiltosporidium tvaerminnensis TaxID=1176355 RepID=A0A4Q9L6U9_9MICR|nr:hypothetical protein CWI37_0369p0010 [Hamiltosporidium tvaerminnensis]
MAIGISIQLKNIINIWDPKNSDMKTRSNIKGFNSAKDGLLKNLSKHDKHLYVEISSKNENPRSSNIGLRFTGSEMKSNGKMDGQTREKTYKSKEISKQINEGTNSKKFINDNCLLLDTNAALFQIANLKINDSSEISESKQKKPEKLANNIGI